MYENYRNNISKLLVGWKLAVHVVRMYNMDDNSQAFHINVFIVRTCGNTILINRFDEPTTIGSAQELGTVFFQIYLNI